LGRIDTAWQVKHDRDLVHVPSVSSSIAMQSARRWRATTALARRLAQKVAVLHLILTRQLSFDTLTSISRNIRQFFV
jgi:hypothetical protein